jgi:hypothetical protein
MDKYLQTLETLTNEFLASKDQNSIQFINVEFNTDPMPFKGMFVITDSRNTHLASEMAFELAILITFTHLTPLGKQLEAIMSKSAVFENFDHKLTGKTATYVLKTGNNVAFIISTFQKIVDSVFPSFDNDDIEVSIMRTRGILGYLTDPD